MTNPAFSLNLFQDFQTIWRYAFMRYAFEAGSLVALTAGVVGYFVVLRRSSFAAHALSHIGFAGAAGAVLLGWNPLIGLFLFTGGGGIGMALLGRKTAGRDVHIGTVLAFMLGLGVLFMNLYSGYAAEAYSLLFGEILGINQRDVWLTGIISLALLIGLASIYRPLLFSSLDEDVAEAKGIPVFLLGMLFMLILAIAISIAVQVTGVLLIFALLITPAAIAGRLTRRPAHGIMLSAIIALLATWLSLFASFYLPYPVSFFLTSSVFICYLIAKYAIAENH